MVVSKKGCLLVCWFCWLGWGELILVLLLESCGFSLYVGCCCCCCVVTLVWFLSGLLVICMSVCVVSYWCFVCVVSIVIAVLCLCGLLV